MAQRGVATVPVAASCSPMRWGLVTLLTSFSFLSYLQRMNISVAAKFMRPELGLSQSAMGEIFSAFMIGYALFQIPAGIAGDRWGPRAVLSAAALIWGITTVLTGLLPGLIGTTAGALTTLLVFRFLLGAAESATYPVAASAIGQWLDPSRRGLANSIVVSGLSIGSAVTPPLIAWLMLRIGWRASFYVTAIPAFALALAWFVYARGQEPIHPPRGELSLDIHSRRFRTNWKELFSSRDLCLLSLSYFFDGYTLFMFVFWFYTYLVEVRGFSVLTGGIFGSMPFIVSSILTPIGGAVTDRAGQRWNRRWGRRIPAMAGFVLSAIFLLSGAKAHNAYLAIAALSLSVGFMQFTEGAFWSTAVDISGRHVGAASGMMNMLGNLGGAASTAVVPILVLHFGWTFAIASGSALSIIGATLWLGVRADRPIAASNP